MREDIPAAAEVGDLTGNSFAKAERLSFEYAKDSSEMDGGEEVLEV